MGLYFMKISVLFTQNTIISFLDTLNRKPCSMYQNATEDYVALWFELVLTQPLSWAITLLNAPICLLCSLHGTGIAHGHAEPWWMQHSAVDQWLDMSDVFAIWHKQSVAIYLYILIMKCVCISVIGRGGETITKIQSESGCKVQVAARK